MKERLKRKQLPVWAGILTILGLVACMIVIIAALFVLADLFNFEYMQYIEYVLFILIGILIIRKWLTEYEYSVIDNEFFVDRYLGKRPRRLFEIRFSDIKYIGSDLPESYSGKKQRLTYLSRRKGVVYIIYTHNGNQKCAFFSPSSKMLDLIQTRMKKGR